MLTVGYGDLTPSNIFEIMAVLLIQIIGILFFYRRYSHICLCNKRDRNNTFFNSEK